MAFCAPPMTPEIEKPKHIRLTSHPAEEGNGVPPIRWGRADPHERGPIIGSTSNRSQRNVIGTHSGSYGVYRALAVAAGALLRGHVPDLTNTLPTDPHRPVSGVGRPGEDRVDGSVRRGGGRRVPRLRSRRATTSARPIAVTKAHIDMPEVHQAIARGRLHGRRPHPAREWLGGRDQGGDRAGVVAARRREALRRAARRTCAARCSRKPAACTPSSSRAATSTCSCRRSAARPCTCSAIRTTSPIPR